MDTICAISTATGESAIGIIRISGADTERIVRKVFRFHKTSGETLVPWHFYYGHIVDGERTLDEGLVVFFKGPKSYTREHMAEIHCHGGAVALRRVYKAVLDTGIRPAEPGEFTKRAFLNGRLDLSQAESIMDVIQAKTELAFDTAMLQLSGNLSQIINGMRVELLRMMTHLAVNMDYPEEDIVEITYDEIRPVVAAIQSQIEGLIRDSDRGIIIREGLKVALIGRPNVGKSSLMNALLQEERAIVTNIPGTTRDVIEEYLNVRGIPVRLMDTAGIRDTEDPVERIGVERTRARYLEADLVLTILDVSEPLTRDDQELLERVSDKPAIIILNKADLDPQISEAAIQKLVPSAQLIRTSTVNDIGLTTLEEAIEEAVNRNQVSSSGYSFVTNVRHRSVLEGALVLLSDVLQGIAEGQPYDLIEMDLRSIYTLLGNITGETVSEDLIESVFSQFCLGK